jgi:hypothetical protein
MSLVGCAPASSWKSSSFSTWGFLTFDIYLAHSVNGFRQRAEYIPLYFSALAPIFLLMGLAFQRKRPLVWKGMGHVVGWSAILIGLTGVVLHLDSSFFYKRTIRSLTYSAPFAAPLAYAGLGFLLLLNRLPGTKQRGVGTVGTVHGARRLYRELRF